MEMAFLFNKEVIYISYQEEDYLMLSGIQHFIFCRRQWALIHIEQLWAENERTVDGNLMHKRAHDADCISKRGNLLTIRALKIHSSELGISGECDVVEFHKSLNGIDLSSYPGSWEPYPIEYKRGTVKDHDADVIQLCAEAMCLEEMLCCEINKGALYYGQTRRRYEVYFSNKIRETVKRTVLEMHDLFQKGYTPKVKMTKSCNACSLKELCLPKLMKNKSVKAYMRQEIEEEMS